MFSKRSAVKSSECQNVAKESVGRQDPQPGTLSENNKMQQYAGIYLLQNHFTCFGCPSHPSSGVHKTVTAASGTGHSI